MKQVKPAAYTALLFLLLSAFVSTAALSAQNLLENEEMLRSRQLQLQSQQALDEGDYERATELAAEAEQLAALGKEKALEEAAAYRANTLLNRAKYRIDYIRLIGAAERVADRYTKARELYTAASEALKGKEYDRSMELSRQVLSTLEGITPRRTGSQTPVLPRYYEVRLIPERRDCFWRIAEYDFIYGDPRAWQNIYEANRSKLPDPDDPGLILPGTILEIPTIGGETREGTWKGDD